MEYLGPDKLIQMKKDFLFPNAMHFYKNPPQLVKGKNQYLYDSNENCYLDFFSGVSVVNCGHCNDFILDATIEQLKTLQHTSIIYLTEPMLKLAEKLAEIMPGDLQHTFFCTSGSEANEGAILLARLHTNRRKIITIDGGLHGRTNMTMSATNIPMWRIDPYLSDDFISIENFYNSNLSLDESAQRSIDNLVHLIQTNPPDTFAALIAEPIQGNGGILTPPLWYFKELKKILEANGILLIIDEVQTGYGRTGKMFAIENFEVVPDIMTTAKALGNGIPISTFSSNSKIAASFNKPSASTLGGNLVSSTTGLAVIKYIETQNLCENSASLGTYLKESLLDLKILFPDIVDVRGIGLMIGMELDSPKSVDIILEELLENGIILGKNGLNRNVLAFQPPLVITKNDIDFLISALKKAFNLL